MFQYLARAKIEFGIEGFNQPSLEEARNISTDEILDTLFNRDFESKKAIELTIEYPKNLPVAFGPFTINSSPNEGVYFDLCTGEIDELKKDLIKEDAFPISVLYADAYIKMEETDKSKRYLIAHRLFSQLEALMRVFQEGLLYIRLHALWPIEDGKPIDDNTLDLSLDADENYFDFYAPRPEPTNRYFRGPYDISESKFQEFMAFFKKFWTILQETPENEPNPIQIAILRFNQSYEGLTLTDRLVELVVALDAMFGEKGQKSWETCSKCAGFLFPPGEPRAMLCRRLEHIYNDRSRILHGDWKETRYTSELIREFEDCVRRSIIKFAEQKTG